MYESVPFVYAPTAFQDEHESKNDPKGNNRTDREVGDGQLADGNIASSSSAALFGFGLRLHKTPPSSAESCWKSARESVSSLPASSNVVGVVCYI